MEENRNSVEMTIQELEAVTGGKNQKVRATKAGIAIHKEAGKESEVIAKTTAGAMANYTGEMKYVKGEAWIRVKWNGKSGWILAKYVSIV